MVDALHRAHVVGTISVDGQSTTDQSFHGGRGDIFYTRRAAPTGDVEDFTFLGGSGDDRGFAIAAAGTSADNFCAFIAGSTDSQDVATVNPLIGGENNQGRADLLLASLCDVAPSITNSGFHKNAASSTVLPNGTVTYTISIDNGGDSPAPVTVRDTLPTALTATGVSGPGCGRAGNAVTCALSAGPGATAIEVTARAGSQCPATIVNTATIQVGNQTFSSASTVQVTCPPPLCGNGRLDPGEQCDGGNHCRANCTLIQCGDHIVDPGEQCDDGNTNGGANDSCTHQCTKQILINGTCSNGGTPCAGALVCGRSCSFVKCSGRSISTPFGPICLFGDSFWLCSTPDTCMNREDATFLAGSGP